MVQSRKSLSSPSLEEQTKSQSSKIVARFSKHIEEDILLLLQQYLGEKTALKVLEKATEIFGHEKFKVRWTSNKPSALSADQMLAFTKIGILHTTLIENTDGTEQGLQEASTMLDNVSIAYRQGLTYKEVLKGGSALPSYLDLHHRDINFSIGYLLACIYSLPNHEKIICPLNNALNDPKASVALRKNTPTGYPRCLHRQYEFYTALKLMTQIMLGRRFVEKAHQEIHRLSIALVQSKLSNQEQDTKISSIKNLKAYYMSEGPK